MKKIPELFPPYNQKEFNNKIKQKHKVDEKDIKGELSNIWRFSELESRPKHCNEILEINKILIQSQ